MKKYIIILMLIILSKESLGQDSLLIFKPAIYGHIETLNRLDTIKIKSKSIVLSNDSSKFNILLVTILDNNKVLYEGSYELEKVDTVNHVLEYRDGESGKEIKGYRFIFLRQGYWYDHTRKNLKSDYYQKGEKVKQKIKY